MSEQENGWIIAIRNIAGSSRGKKRRSPINAPNGDALVAAVRKTYRSVGDTTFRLLCERLFVEKRRGLSRQPIEDGRAVHISQHEAELAAQIAVHVESLAAATFFKVLADREARSVLVDSVIRGHQKKIRKSRPLNILREYAKSKYPDLSVKELLGKMENEGVIRSVSGGWELAATGDPLPKSIDSAVSRARKS